MIGSLQTKKGFYYAVLNFKHPDGKNKPTWIPTGIKVTANRKSDEKLNKRMAEEKLTELINQHSETFVPGNNMLFVDAIKQWLQNSKFKVELSTYEGYETYVNRHIIPFFEPLNLTIRQIAPLHIKQYYDFKFKKGRLDGKEGGLSIPSIKKHSMILKQILNEAVILEMIPKNPAQNVPLPKKESTEPKGMFLNVVQANEILKAFEGHELQPIVFVTLYYGLRRSEVLGLKWDAIDFDSDTLKIQHTVVKNKTIQAKNKTKTSGSKRSYLLLPEVKELLLCMKQKQLENKKLFRKEYKNPDGYIFTREDGTLFRPDHVTRGFQRVLKRNDFPKMRFHDLRHSTASILYDKGWDIKAIQDWLGHADVETTANIYTHISSMRKKVMADDLGNTFTI